MATEINLSISNSVKEVKPLKTGLQLAKRARIGENRGINGYHIHFRDEMPVDPFKPTAIAVTVAK